MKELDLNQIVQVIGGKVITDNAWSNHGVTGVSLDSRNIKVGELFFALPGERVDGHAFVSKALQAGAAGAVVNHWPVGEPMPDASLNFGPAPIIEVADVLSALQDLAAWYRRLFAIPIIGVTGSTGKTTTKDLLAAVLSKGFRTLKTSGNYNNEIGVPLTILELTDQHQAAVVEMAMRGPGEIAALSTIVAPTVGLITNIGHTHLELLGTQENIALAKGELLDSLPETGWAVLNADDPWQGFLGNRCKVRTFYYGLQPATGIFASDLQLQGSAGSRFQVHLPDAVGEVWVPVPGRHNIYNALAALGVGWLLGMKLEEMAAGLAEAQLSAMRLDLGPGYQGTTLINDAYNANPDSMLAALRVLDNIEGKRRVAVLGEMYELGDFAEEGHRRVGEEAARLKVSFLVTVGKLAENIAEGALEAGLPQDCVRAVPDKNRAVNLVKDYLEPGDVVLVKGSRGMHMEEIVSALQPAGQDRGENRL